MTVLPAFASRAFRARTHRVHAINCIEALVDLDFGVTIRRTFVIEGLAVGVLDADTLDRAAQCMVILVGGKRLIVQPDPRRRESWGYLRHVSARVYLRERVSGFPIGYTESIPGFDTPVLELAPYLTWLASKNFSTDLVKQTMNGR